MYTSQTIMVKPSAPYRMMDTGILSTLQTVATLQLPLLNLELKMLTLIVRVSSLGLMNTGVNFYSLELAQVPAWQKTVAI